MIRYTPGRDAHHRPHDWLPENVDLRVLMRFETGEDRYPTFGGVKSDFATFQAVIDGNATFHDLTLYETGGWADDYDVTCDVTGVTTKRGRSVLWDSIDTGEFTVNLRDQSGIYDPRATDTPFGPGRRIRAGIRVQVDLDTGSGWFPIGVGFVDSWLYDVPPEGSTVATVAVTAGDGFAHLATCVGPVVAPIGGGETMGPRLNRILDHADWPPSWGARRLDAGSIALQATTLGGGSDTTTTDPDAGTDALSEMKLVVRTEDGLLFMDRDGAVVAWDGNYRDRSKLRLRVMGRGAERHLANWWDVTTTFDTWSDVAKVATWDDLRTSTPLPGWHPDGGPDSAGVVAVCATTIEVADIDDDVRNDIEVQMANVPTNEDGTPVYPAEHRVDPFSVRRYGRHTYEDNTLIHTDPVWSYALAERYMIRWGDGEPRVNSVAIDCLREWHVAGLVSTLNFGDLIDVVDRVHTAGGLVTTRLELQGVDHALGPTLWTATLHLDQPRGTTVVPVWDSALWDQAKWT